MPESQPVFVDPTGRRHTLIRLAGIGGAIAVAALVVAVGLGVATGSGVPFTPWAEPSARHPGSAATPGRHPARDRPDDPAASTGPSGPAPSGPAPGGLAPGGGPQPTSAASGPTPKPSSAQPTPTAGTPTAAATPTKHGNPHTTPPGLARKTKTPAA